WAALEYAAVPDPHGKGGRGDWCVVALLYAGRVPEAPAAGRGATSTQRCQHGPCERRKVVGVLVLVVADC
ncbi:hypothetical protein ACFVW8_38345, partial [Streptomyces sp. NPDC058221]|uniref:hypothetical protein n=1 Tax=Streptomyces sp. NPDC058221 TaxID=3346388 RepID=UPI0036E31B73